MEKLNIQDGDILIRIAYSKYSCDREVYLSLVKVWKVLLSNDNLALYCSQVDYSRKINTCINVKEPKKFKRIRNIFDKEEKRIRDIDRIFFITVTDHQRKLDRKVMGRDEYNCYTFKISDNIWNENDIMNSNDIDISILESDAKEIIISFIKNCEI